MYQINPRESLKLLSNEWHWPCFGLKLMVLAMFFFHCSGVLLHWKKKAESAIVDALEALAHAMGNRINKLMEVIVG